MAQRGPDGRWQKGVTGNPKGRATRGRAFAELLREKLDKERFVEKLCELAYEGNLEAARLILSYVEPLPKNNRGLLGAGGVTIVIKEVSGGIAGIGGAAAQVMDIRPTHEQIGEGEHEDGDERD